MKTKTTQARRKATPRSAPKQAPVPKLIPRKPELTPSQQALLDDFRDWKKFHSFLEAARQGEAVLRLVQNSCCGSALSEREVDGIERLFADAVETLQTAADTLRALSLKEAGFAENRKATA